MAHQNIRATIWAPFDQLTLGDVEDMVRTARMLGARDSCPVWGDDFTETDDKSGDGSSPGRLNIGTVVAWRMGDI